MTKVQYYCAATLDGFIADVDDGLDWLTSFESSFNGEAAEPNPTSEAGAYERFYEGVGAVISGSTSYEFVLEHHEQGEWPYAGKPYWVLSSRDLPVPPGEDVRVREGSVPDLHDELQASAGERNLWIVGGGNVASQFADAGLLDELHLTVVPVFLGTGKRVFDSPPAAGLTLVGTRTFQNGMVELRYELEPPHAPRL